MILDGDTSVIDALKEKKRLMEAGEEHGHLKIMLVCGGGCLKAAYSWGACIALAEAGYDRCFSTVVGTSSGALAAAYLLSGNIAAEAALLHQEACSKEFFNLLRPFLILNTPYLRTVLERYPGSGLNTEAVLQHPTKFILGLSRFETAEPVLFQPTTPEELYAGLQATISMGGAVSEPIYIDGERYFDGENTQPYIRNQIYDELEYTHVLDMTNQEQDAPTFNWPERLLLPTFYRSVTNRALRAAAYNRFKNRVEFLQNIPRRSERPVCVVYGDNSIGSYEANPQKIKAVAERSRKLWRRQLSQESCD